MSGKGGAALTDASGVSHAYFGIGNGSFQNADANGAPLNPILNWGQSIVDFRLWTAGFDSMPSGYFTPFGGVPVQPPTSNTNPPSQNPVYWTFESLNQNDLDMAASGIMLLQDLSGIWRLLAIDKGAYGYLLTSGNLGGFASGDPGNLSHFAANLSQDPACQDPVTDDQACHRITSLALNAGASPPRVFYWPHLEALTGLQLSYGATQFQGAQSITWTPGSTTVTKACGPGTCFTDEVVPGDTLVACGCTAPNCPTIVAVDPSGTSATLSQALPTGCTPPQIWSYAGYFINPIRDTHPSGQNVQYPGGSVVVTSNAGSDAVVWGLATVGSLQGGTLFAYNAALGMLWCSNSFTQCAIGNNVSNFAITNPQLAAGTFALPTVVNGYVYIPTFYINNTGPNSSCQPNHSCCTGSRCYGVIPYSGH